MAADRYYDLTRLCGIIGIALLAMVAAELGYGVTSWQYLSLPRLGAAAADGATGSAEAEALWASFRALEMPVLYLYWAAMAASYVSGAIWTFRAARNAARLAPDPRRISPFGAVGWYAVPILSLYMPFRAMRQILNASTRPPRALNAPAPSLLRWWWGTVLLVMVMAYVSLALPATPNTSAVIPSRPVIDVLLAPLAVISIWLWWQVVTLITNLQKAAGPAAPTDSVQEVIQ